VSHTGRLQPLPVRLLRETVPLQRQVGRLLREGGRLQPQDVLLEREDLNLLGQIGRSERLKRDDVAMK
jgi:hypothetical protein